MGCATCPAPIVAIVTIALEDGVLYALRLQNIDTVAFVYGDDAAQAVCRDIEACLARMLDEGGAAVRIARRESGAYDVQLNRPQNPVEEQRFKSILFSVCKSIATTVRSNGLDRFLVCPVIAEVPLTTYEWPLTAGLAHCHAKIGATAGDSLFNYSTAEAFKSDMNAAVEWVEDLCSDLLLMSWDQVRSLTDDRSIEHLTGRLAKLATDGSAVTLRGAEIAMRRLGMANILDHEIITRCLASSSRELAAPVAVEVSTQTLSTHFPMLMHLLSNCDDQACHRIRLTIKADTNDHPTELTKLIGLARSRGIAVGTKIGLSCKAGWLRKFQSNPDFIVIPAAIVRSTISRPDNIMALSTIGALAKLVSPKIIAEGVDCALLAKNARNAGIEWGQGHFLGKTSWSRTRATSVMHPVNSQEHHNSSAPFNREV